MAQLSSHDSIFKRCSKRREEADKKQEHKIYGPYADQINAS